ncbi:hypothetical protein ACFUJ2_27505, partial [Streptomyces coelicoflavus]
GALRGVHPYPRRQGRLWFFVFPYDETVFDGAVWAWARADAMSSPDGHLLLFGLLPERPAENLPPSAATDETEGWHLLRRAEELAFPLHTRAVRAFFEGRYI